MKLVGHKHWRAFPTNWMAYKLAEDNGILRRVRIANMLPPDEDMRRDLMVDVAEFIKRSEQWSSLGQK